MKKTLSLTFILLLLALTACGASSATGGAGSTTPSDAAAPALSTAQTLLLGTLKLEGTGQAVTAEQAADLLPLWKVYDELLTRDNAAQAEFDALAGQIQGTMTSDQLKAITAMNLTQQDMAAEMQAHNVVSQPQISSSSNANAQGGGMTPPDGEGMPVGGAPGMGGGSAASSSSTSGTTVSQNPGADSMSTLIGGLIELLQSRAAA